MSEAVTLPVEFKPEEKELFLSICEEKEVAPGDFIHTQGDPGESLAIVIDGVVEVRGNITDDVEKIFLTVRPGGLLGTLAFIDGHEHPGSAVAVETSRILLIAREAFDGFMEAHPEIGLKFVKYLVTNLAGQVRLTVEQYKRTIEWNLQVTGVMDLNLRGIVSDRPDVKLDLTNGGQVFGRLLKFEKSGAGHELLVQTIDGELVMIPYHAVAVLSLADRKES